MREEPEKFAAEVVGKVLESWAIKAELESQVEESEGEQAVVLKIKTEEPGFIIGYHGQTLKDLEFITNLIVYRKLGEWNRVILDVGDYREKRKEFLETLAQRTAERIRGIVARAEHPLDNGRKVKVTISIGGCIYPQDAQNESHLLRMADKALYLAKEKGKNRVVFCGD